MKFFVLFLVAVLSLPLLASPLQSYSRDEVKAIQTSLKESGYPPGPIDGLIGPKTRKALRAFQKARNLPVTGSIDPTTASELQAEKKGPSAPTNLRVVEIKVE